MRILKYWLYAALPLIAVTAVVFMSQDIVGNLWLQNPGLNVVIFGATALGVLLCLRCLWLAHGDDSLLAQFELAPQELEARLERGDRMIQTSLSATLLGHAFRLRQRPGSDFDISRMHEEYDYIRDSLQDRLRLPMYIIVLLVALGLIGVFLGMMDALSGARQILSGLNLSHSSAGNSMFAGLRYMLNAIGSVFAVPFFAVCGAILLGFISLPVRGCHTALLKRARALLGETTNLRAPDLDAMRHTQMPESEFSTNPMPFSALPGGASRFASRTLLSQLPPGADASAAQSQAATELAQSLQQLNLLLQGMQQNQLEQQELLRQLLTHLGTVPGLQAGTDALESLNARLDEFAQGVGAALRLMYQSQKDGFDDVVRTLQTLQSQAAKPQHDPTPEPLEGRAGLQ